MILSSQPDEAVLEDLTQTQDLACSEDNMITRQDLSSAVDSKKAAGHDIKVYPGLLQEHNETMLHGVRSTGK